MENQTPLAVIGALRLLKSGVPTILKLSESLKNLERPQSKD